LCDHNLPTLQTDRQTDITLVAYASHEIVNAELTGCLPFDICSFDVIAHIYPSAAAAAAVGQLVESQRSHQLICSVVYICNF